MGYPIDYRVPELGRDRDMIANDRSLRIAEEQLNHKLHFGTAASKAERHNEAKDTMYDYDPALDGDMITTKKNLVDT